MAVQVKGKTAEPSLDSALLFVPIAESPRRFIANHAQVLSVFNLIRGQNQPPIDSGLMVHSQYKQPPRHYRADQFTESDLPTLQVV